MTAVTFTAHKRTWTLTDEASQCSHGMPVLMEDDGAQLGPWDIAVENIRQGELGFRHGFTARARAVAAYAKDDYPDDPTICTMVDKFLAVPDA